MDNTILAKGSFKKCTGLAVCFLVLTIIAFITASLTTISLVGIVMGILLYVVAVRWSIYASIYFYTTLQETIVYPDRVVLKTRRQGTTHIALKDITSVTKIGQTDLKVCAGSLAIRVYALENCDEIINAINEARTTSKPVVGTDSESVASELKTYQDLLNSGAITQEEYDAKKKQILNL